ncbi:substrate-binding domain-containing protein [Sulfuriroseicoccus oceanibius]|uniref:GntR family transcriptional regulator n=1 Tax=Sulfuriroseicoccus oceanibius TaxID=2707525 RepID=A0A6B3L8H5_9BACT|nr:substrate-binding domain-containing protein [Sulfuriroseicoccus oceanibius]QQL46132.1 GntR family transcriptional regulator [Sulfuriroseicoccus oceanibius]
MPLPQNKSAQAACLIKEMIISGVYTTSLPSERRLAEKLLISRNCVREALHILTEDGTINPPDRSRRREIRVRPTSPHPNVPKRCVVVTPNAEHQSTEQFLGQLARLRHLLSSSQITVDVQTTQAFRHSSVERALTELTEANPSVIWLLHQCPRPIQQWFHDQKQPAIIFGSRFPGITIPSIDSDHYATAHHATSKLLRMGHRHIGLILPDATLAGAGQAESGFNDALDQSSASAERLILRHGFNVPELISSLNHTFRRDTRPTALLIQNNHHFLTTFSHLLSIGCRIPQDVSLISMAYSSAYDYLSPSPAYYTTGTRMIRMVASAVAHATQSDRQFTPLIPEFVQGETAR